MSVRITNPPSTSASTTNPNYNTIANAATITVSDGQDQIFVRRLFLHGKVVLKGSAKLCGLR